MPKERSSKSCRNVSGRPFKMYDPSRPPIYHFADSIQFEQQMLLPNNAFVMQQYQQNLRQQQQQHQQQQQQHMMSNQLNQSSQQVFGLQVHFQQNPPYLQQNAQNSALNHDATNFVYDELGLDDSGPSLLRSDLIASRESLIQQREQDLNISSISGNPPRSQVQSVFPSNVRVLKTSFDALTSAQDSQTLFDNLLAAPSNCQTRNIEAPSSMNSLSMGNGQGLQNPPCHSMLPTSALYNMQISSNGISLPGIAMNSVINIGQFPVKLEAEDDSLTVMRNLNTSVASPLRNEQNGHFFQDNFSMITGKPFLESTSAASMPLVNANMGDLNTSLISPVQNAIDGNFYQESFIPMAGRSLSESSTSSTSISLDDSSATSPPNQANTNRTTMRADGHNDPLYHEKRRKNNASAKRSREARRTKEEMIVLKLVSGEQENIRLNAQIHVLRKEAEEYERRIYELDQM